MARKILVVEDSPTQAERVRLLLESAGYEVAVARNRKIRRVIYIVLAVVVLGGVSFFLAKLKPAAQTVEASTVIPDTVKWNCVFREINGVPPGQYIYRCYVVVGTLDDVRDSMDQLYAYFSTNRVVVYETPSLNEHSSISCAAIAARPRGSQSVSTSRDRSCR